MNDEQTEHARQKLKAMNAKAKSRRELAWKAIQQGSHPMYVAKRYGFTVEQMERAKAAMVEQQRKIEEQRNAANQV